MYSTFMEIFFDPRKHLRWRSFQKCLTVESNATPLRVCQQII